MAPPLIPVYTPWVARNQRAYVLDCLDSNMLTHRGKYVEMFEGLVARHAGRQHAVAVANGSLALHAAYMVAGLRQNLPVIAPTMTYAATISQLLILGAEPVLVDCDERFQIDLGQVEEALAKKLARAVVVAPLYADCPHMYLLEDICHRHNATLLLDAAEAFGCQYGHMPVAGWGQMATYSFFANKVITCGEGGAIVTDDDSVAKRLRLFRSQGDLGQFRHSGPGSNLRMTNIQAAIGVAQFEDLPTIDHRKHRVARFYRDNLPASVRRVWPMAVYSSQWMPVFGLPEGAAYPAFRDFCLERGVETRPTFYPVHTMPGFARCYKPFSLTVAESTVDRFFNLPSSPALTLEELGRVVDVVTEFCRKV